MCGYYVMKFMSEIITNINILIEGVVISFTNIPILTYISYFYEFMILYSYFKFKYMQFFGWNKTGYDQQIFDDLREEWAEHMVQIISSQEESGEDYDALEQHMATQR